MDRRIVLACDGLIDVDRSFATTPYGRLPKTAMSKKREPETRKNTERSERHEPVTDFDCRNLTEANGGRIEVTSEPGKGTVFLLLLPIGRSET